MRRRRHKKYIVGAYRPDYEEEESVTYEQWLEYLERYRREAAAKKASMPDLHYRKGNGLDERSLEKRGGCTERISCKD